MVAEQKKLPPPPRLIATLAAGFETTASHVTVILPPVLLDLFLWLGPHLRLKQLLSALILQLFSLASQASITPSDAAQAQDVWASFLEQFNLLSILRTFPVGVSSLMGGRMPIETPFSAAIQYEVSSVADILGWGLLLVVLGWIFGGTYFHWVSGVALNLDSMSRPLFRSIVQTILLSVIWLVLAFILGVPALMVFGALVFISPLVAQAALLLLAFFSLWVIIPVYFSPHGIFIYQQNVFAAILNSLRMARFTLPSSGLFLLSAILLSQGLDFLWRTPPEDSWWTVVGIGGHAFVSTALLAASFIYYRDVNVWLQAVFEQLKAQMTSARA